MKQRNARIALASALLWLSMVVRSVAAEPPPSEARRLASQALETYKRAEAAEQGFAEIYDQGLDLARRAIALDPTVADAHYAVFLNLGRKSQRTGVGSEFLNLSELKTELAKTLELDPNHAHGWEARGEMLLKLPRLFGGSASEGESALRRSQALAPNWAKPVLRLAQLHEQNGKIAEAQTEAALALELARKSGDDLFAREATEVLTAVSKTDR